MRDSGAHYDQGMSIRSRATRHFLSFLLAIPIGVTIATGEDSRLATAAANQDRDTVLALLAEGADVDAPRADGATALLFSAHWDDVELAERLLAAGADPNAADDHGVTALARAVENTSLDMMRTLLAAGADVNAPQVSGLVPLMTAARTGNAAVVRTLITHGADLKGVSRSLLNFASGRLPVSSANVTPLQQLRRRAGPARRGRPPGTSGRGSPGPAEIAVPPPPARSPPSVESSDRHATA